MGEPPASGDEIYLDALLQQREGNNLEFKSATDSYRLEKAIEYAAALANEGGGYLILGVNDDRVVLGTKAFDDVMEVERRIFETIRIKVQVRQLAYRSLRVLVLAIPARRKGEPIGISGRFLMRAGESLVGMSSHRLAEIFAEGKDNPLFEPLASSLSLERVRELLDVDQFFVLMPENHPTDATDALSKLVNYNLLVEGPSGYGVTRLGALFLARDLGNFSDLKYRRIRILKYANETRNSAVIDSFDTRGYALSFEEVLRLVNSHLPVAEIIEGDYRQTVAVYPPTALREFLANALVHQDFREEGVQITVEMFADRVEIRNPGEPIIDVRRFVDETRSRNPELAEIMRLAGICEVRGSGVDRALMQIEDLMRPAPTFRAADGATTVTLFAEQHFSDMAIEERVWAAFLHCCVKYQSSSRLTNTTLRQRFALSTSKVALVSQTISSAIEAGLIKADPGAGTSRRHARYVPFFA